MTTAPGWYFCLRCGGELAADARFCGRCGQPVHATESGWHFGDPTSPTILIGDVRLPLAPLGKRFGALIIDASVAFAVTYASFLAVLMIALVVTVDESAAEPTASLPARVFFGMAAGLSVATMGVLWALESFGWSPGKAATGVRVVRLDGRRPGAIHGLVRYSMRLLSLVVLGLGYFWALWDDRKQTWHDKLAGTVVVRAETLDKQLPERRPDPLVTRTRVWWLAALSAVILIGGLTVNVLMVVNAEGDLFDPVPYEPYRQEERSVQRSLGFRLPEVWLLRVGTEVPRAGGGATVK